MKSRNISKCRYFCSIYAEKFLELMGYLFYLFKRRDSRERSIKESYIIHEENRGKPFVEEFLKARKRISELNNIKMEITYTDAKGKEGVIGKAILLRKKKIISQATLWTKNNGDELIYWSFKA
ncbi:MAG: hypothetical protein IJ436_07270 [Bacteroidaceae bacterium]|nr:hypothetical protein [Bacteroidaceae bacterium]